MLILRCTFNEGRENINTKYKYKVPFQCTHTRISHRTNSHCFANLKCHVKIYILQCTIMSTRLRSVILNRQDTHHVISFKNLYILSFL